MKFFCALLLATGLSSAALANDFSVEDIKFIGTGCPSAKETGYLVQGDILWLKFAPEQKAVVGPDLSLGQSRKNCAATIRFADKRLYQVVGVAYYLESELADKQNARLTASWFYEGESEQGTYSDEIVGPSSGAYYRNFQAVTDQDISKPCGVDRALTVNSSIRISGPREISASSQWQILGLRLKAGGC